MITKIAIANYRSLRDVVLSLDRLNLVTGPNGSGKSNLYRALRLIADTAQSSAIESIAREGGFSSVLWAGLEHVSKSVKDGRFPVEGTQRVDKIHLRLGFSSDEFSYAIDYGLSTLQPGASMFFRDAEVKREVMWRGEDLWHHSRAIMDRRKRVVQARDESGAMSVALQSISMKDSALGSLVDPANHPEIYQLREEIRNWRFYDQFRTDPQSPVRRPHVGTFSPVLAYDGRNLPSAWQTICEIGDSDRLQKHLEDAFARSSVNIVEVGGMFELQFSQHGLLRPMGQSELSDGTLRFLYWLVALLTPRPPRLMVLNEPETSIHEDLIPALGRLIVACSENMQIWVVSHSKVLIETLVESGRCNCIELTKELSETMIKDEGPFSRPSWRWPSR